MITQEEHDAAVAVPLEAQLAVREVKNGCEAAASAAYFCDYVVKTVLNDAAFGADVAARQRLLYRGGLTITTTLDRTKQELAQNAVNDRVPPTDSSGVGVALSSVEAGTGRIVAMAQNRIYSPQQTEEPVPGGSAINYNVDKAMGGGAGFQPGSTYKPFTLATWLASGNTMNETVNANQKEWIPSKDFTSSCGGIGSEPYKPSNSEGSNRGNISVLQATYGSVNTAYVDMASQLDLCKIRDTAAALGVHRADAGELQYTPATVLGTNEVAPLTMAAAYAAFANKGIWCKPIAIADRHRRLGQGAPQARAGVQAGDRRRRRQRRGVRADPGAGPRDRPGTEHRPSGRRQDGHHQQQLGDLVHRVHPGRAVDLGLGGDAEREAVLAEQPEHQRRPPGPGLRRDARAARSGTPT